MGNYCSKTRLIVLALLLFLLASCTADKPRKIEQENTINWEFEKELDFNVGFFSGNIQKQIIDGEEFLAVADFESHSKMVLCNTVADTIATFSLKEVKALNESVLACEIVSLDTILVLTKYTNNLYFLNREGKIWKQRSLDSNLGDDRFELGRMAAPAFLLSNKKSAIFSLSYLGNDLPSNYQFWDKPADFQRNKLNAPQLVFVKDIFADSLEFSFHLDGFYLRFLNENHYTAEGFGMYEVPGGFLFSSSFSDTLYFFDNNFQLQQQAAIPSNYSKGYILPPTLEETQANMQVLNDRYANQGCIKRLAFLDSAQLYLVVMAHNKGVDSPKKHSLIGFDTNFNYVGEVVLTPDAHPNVLIFNNRIFIPNYQKYKGDDDYFKKVTYAIYNIKI